MLEPYFVTFAGHREVSHFREIELMLDSVVRELLKTKEFVEFYVGLDGDFDALAVSAIRRARRAYGNQNSAINLVLPYRKADMTSYEAQFDTVMIAETAQGVHPKKAITVRNRCMIDNSNMLICFIERQTGGAAATFKYAKSKPDIIIKNLFDELWMVDKEYDDENIMS